VNNFPRMITVVGFNEKGNRTEKTYFFEMVAPITGDGIYTRSTDSGNREHALYTVPNARQNQLRVLGTRI
jgi:hypothetical protein